VRPKRLDARRAWLRAIAPAVSGAVWGAGVGLPRLGVPAGRDDRCGTAFGDGVVAFAGVAGPVGGDAGDLLIGRDLVEQFGQHAGIAHVTGGELGSPDF
jgi:hypothetical protein